MNFSKYTPRFELEKINATSGCVQNVYVDENLNLLEVCKKAAIIFQKDQDKYNVILIKQDRIEDPEQRVKLNHHPMSLQDAHLYAKGMAVKDNVHAVCTSLGRKTVALFKDLPLKTQMDIREQAITCMGEYLISA